MKERVWQEVQTFGAAVRAWRVAEGLTLHDLADLLGLNAVQVAGIDRGIDERFVMQQWPRIVADLQRLGFQL